MILIVLTCLLSFSGLCLLGLFWRQKVNKKINWIDRLLLGAFIFSYVFVLTIFIGIFFGK
jgi:hypothetical protein